MLLQQGIDIIKDIGSGINYNKKGLNQLIDMITNSEVDKGKEPIKLKK
jgi:predicted site-specific integrase-resolvase